jgi:hypothetical protein
MLLFKCFGVATLVCAAAALVGATGAVAGPAVTETTTFVYNGTNLCTMEDFSGTGNLHSSITENLSTSGVLETHVLFSIDGLNAVTLLGKRYIVQDVYNHEFVFGSSDEDTFQIRAHYIRQGEDGSLILGDDFYFYLRTHITADPTTGAVKSLHVDTSGDDTCQ